MSDPGFLAGFATAIILITVIRGIVAFAKWEAESWETLYGAKP